MLSFSKETISSLGGVMSLSGETSIKTSDKIFKLNFWVKLQVGSRLRKLQVPREGNLERVPPVYSLFILSAETSMCISSMFVLLYEATGILLRKSNMIVLLDLPN